MSRITPPSFTVFFATFVLSLSLISCGVADFVGAYFNTYYNSQKLFAEAEEEIWSQPDTRLAGHNLLIPLNISGGAKQKLTSVIEKCSKLLQYHPESKLVDNALLMVGKAYFYQADFARAERKFKELLDTHPNSDLVLEARMLLAYSQYKGNNVEGATALAREVLEAARAAGSDDIEGSTALLLGQIQQDGKNYSQAREHYEVAGRKAGTADLRATALLAAADMYGQAGDSLHALDAFLAAGKEATNYLAEFRAQIGQARMLRKVGRGEEALDLLDRLRRNTNYKEFWGEVDLETGDTYASMDAFDSAIARYVYVDTAYARSESAANADYRLGQLYEKQLGQFDSARTAYARGRGAAPQWAVAPLILQRSDLLNRYNALTNVIRTNDSIKMALLARKDSAITPAPPERKDSATTPALPAPRDSAMTPALTRRESAALPPPLARKDSALAASDSARRAPREAPVSLDTVNARLAGAMNELATLWYTGFESPDSASSWYGRLLREFPGSPHTPRALFALARIAAAQDSVHNRTQVDSLYRQIVDRYPDSEFAGEARSALGLPPRVKVGDPAEAAYHRGEELLLKGSFAEAVDTLRNLQTLHPASPFASRAEYAVGWIYEQKLNLPDSAIASYRQLARQYPASTYAALVKPKLEMVDQKNAPPPAAGQGSPAPSSPAPGLQPAPGTRAAPAGTAPQDSAAARLLPRLRVNRQPAMGDSLGNLTKSPASDSLGNLTKTPASDSLGNLTKTPTSDSLGNPVRTPVNDSLKVPRRAPAAKDSTGGRRRQDE